MIEQSDSELYICRELSGSVLHMHSILFQILFPRESWHNTDHSLLCYAVGPGWSSGLHTVVCVCVSPKRGSPLEELCQYFQSAGQPARLAFGGTGRASLGGFRFSRTAIRQVWWEGGTSPYMIMHSRVYSGDFAQSCAIWYTKGVLIRRKGLDTTERLNWTDQVGRLE